jgi:hypothetical protein
LFTDNVKNPTPTREIFYHSKENLSLLWKDGDIWRYLFAIDQYLANIEERQVTTVNARQPFNQALGELVWQVFLLLERVYIISGNRFFCGSGFLEML